MIVRCRPNRDGMTVLETTSRRERRLWIGALLVLVAIWSSLFLAGALVPILREKALLGAAFGVGFVLAIVAVAWGALRIGETGREVWIGLALAVAAWMVLVRLGVPARTARTSSNTGCSACSCTRHCVNGAATARPARPLRSLRSS